MQVGKLERRVTYAIALFLALQGVAMSVVYICTCVPPKANWEDVSAHCIDGRVVALIRQVLQAISDLALLVLPIPTIRRLQISFGRKIGLAVTFLSGSM